MAIVMQLLPHMFPDQPQPSEAKLAGAGPDNIILGAQIVSSLQAGGLEHVAKTPTAMNPQVQPHIANLKYRCCPSLALATLQCRCIPWSSH